jgi:hypothetical protein
VLKLLEQQEEQGNNSPSSTSGTEAQKGKRRAPSKKELEKEAEQRAKKTRRQAPVELGQRRLIVTDWSDDEVSSTPLLVSAS